MENFRNMFGTQFEQLSQGTKVMQVAIELMDQEETMLKKLREEDLQKGNAQRKTSNEEANMDDIPSIKTSKTYNMKPSGFDREIITRRLSTIQPMKKNAASPFDAHLKRAISLLSLTNRKLLPILISNDNFIEQIQFIISNYQRLINISVEDSRIQYAQQANHHIDQSLIKSYKYLRNSNDLSSMSSQLRMRILPSNLLSEQKFTLAERILIRISEISFYKTTEPIFQLFNNAFFDLVDEFQVNNPLKQFWNRLLTWASYVFNKKQCNKCRQINLLKNETSIEKQEIKKESQLDNLVLNKQKEQIQSQQQCNLQSEPQSKEETQFFVLIRAFIELAHATKLELDFSYAAVSMLSKNNWNWQTKKDYQFDGQIRFLEDYIEKGHQRLELLFYRFGTHPQLLEASRAVFKSHNLLNYYGKSQDMSVIDRHLDFLNKYYLLSIFDSIWYSHVLAQHRQNLITVMEIVKQQADSKYDQEEQQLNKVQSLAARQTIIMLRKNVMETLDQVKKIVEQFNRRSSPETEQFLLHDMIQLNQIDLTSSDNKKFEDDGPISSSSSEEYSDDEQETQLVRQQQEQNRRESHKLQCQINNQLQIESIQPLDNYGFRTIKQQAKQPIVNIPFQCCVSCVNEISRNQKRE